VSSGGRIGVDLEILKSRDWVSLKDQFLHPLEVEWVMSVQGRERDIRGHSCWCRKEALLKALGTGITHPLESIAFSPEGLLVAFPEFLECDAVWRTATLRFSSSAVMAVAWPASEMAMSKHDILNPIS
jgi:phosphopantetheinyl transferase